MPDVEYVILKSDENILLMLATTCSAANATEAQSLVTEQGDGTHNPYSCYDCLCQTSSAVLIGLEMQCPFEQALHVCLYSGEVKKINKIQPSYKRR